MLLCTEYSKERCRVTCHYAKGRGIFTSQGEEPSDNTLDDIWSKRMKERTNYTNCYDGMMKKVIVINSLLEYYMEEIIKKNEEK
jgi:hypothetical protein